eukprot:COSAG01_NODE_1670_length_9556_cov_4.917733_5_plen_133_part_00
MACANEGHIVEENPTTKEQTQSPTWNQGHLSMMGCASIYVIAYGQSDDAGLERVMNARDEVLTSPLEVVASAQDGVPDGLRSRVPLPAEQRVDPALATLLLGSVCRPLRHQCDGGAGGGQLNDVFETKILAF